MTGRKHISFFVALWVLSIGAMPVSAQWTADGIPITTQQLFAFSGKLAPDGTGGAFAFYGDNLSAQLNADLYAVRVDGQGQLVWQAPITLAEQVGDDVAMSACSDGVGGAYVCFIDNYLYPPSRLYVQRVAADGTVLFSGLGVELSATCDEYASMVPDGQGGVYVFWYGTTGADSDIFGQRLSAAGAIQWEPGGATICGEAGDQIEPEAVAAPGGRAVVVWRDLRDAGTTGMDIYAQRVLDTGDVGWSAAGLPVCAAAAEQNHPQIVRSPLGGTVIAWQDDRNDSSGDIYAQFLAIDGSPNWTVGGIEVAAGAFQQEGPVLACFGDGSVVVQWNDYRNSPDRGLGIQFIATTGSVFVPGGWLATTGSVALSPRLVTDDFGGVIGIWIENTTGQNEVYATRFRWGGTEWSTSPQLVSSAAGAASYPSLISDGDGGVLITYHQQFAGWAQRLGLYGDWGYPAGSVAAIEDVPADEGGWVRIRCAASRLESEPGNLDIAGYNVWRRLPPGIKVTADPPTDEDMAHGKAVGSLLGAAAAKAAGLPAGNWESVGYHAAVGLDEYLLLAPTHTDSTGAGPAWETFCITTHTNVVGYMYTSLPDSGFSVDNLAPGSPKDLAGTAAWLSGGVELVWSAGDDAGDIDSYRIYRGQELAFPTDLAHLVGSTAETMFFDPVLPPGIVSDKYTGLFYKVTAVDRHGNESDPAVLTPQQISGADNTPRLGNRLAQNHPNPFNPATTITFELARTGRVWLTVFDISGHRICKIIDGEIIEQGRRQVVWRGVDDAEQSVAAGVYFYRLELPEFSATRRMALVR